MDEPPYRAKSIANYFLGRNPNLNQGQLHPLIYAAHGMFLAAHKRPLLHEFVQAWEFGPAIRSIFDEFRYDGVNPLGRLAHMVVPNNSGVPVSVIVPEPSSKEVIVLLEYTWRQYGNISGSDLCKLFCLPGSPWYITVKKIREKYGSLLRNAVIDNELIQKYFEGNVHDGGRKAG